MISKERLNAIALKVSVKWVLDGNVAVAFANALLEQVEAESEVVVYRHKHDNDLEWETTKPRNHYVSTVLDTVNEIQTYIDNGYKYKIQKLIALPLVEGD